MKIEICESVIIYFFCYNGCQIYRTISIRASYNLVSGSNDLKIIQITVDVVVQV